MKKLQVLFIFAFIFLLISGSFVLAELTPEEEEEKVTLAYNCLENKVDSVDCSRMSVEESIFSLLAIEKCEQKVIDNANGDLTCWPKTICNIKNTAQAILALSKIGYDTENAEEWLFARNSTPTGLDWYLEIETQESSSCTISYGSSSYGITIGEDKKITGNAGPCLSKANNDYFLKIDENCYNEEFAISCTSNFLTTLLYQKGQTWYVLGEGSVHSEEAGGTTLEKINSFCFANGGSCDYEGSLWAAAVLSSKGYNEELSGYMPYLIGEASENEKYLPEAFLYLLTNSNDYATALLQNQINGKYWKGDASGNKYYDTSFALFPFQYETLTEKTNSKEWLILDVQQEDGCWDNGNILNNAFILYSIWPEYGPSTPGITTDDCIEAGYECVEEEDCTETILPEYECSGSLVCCGSPSPGGGGDLDCEDEGYFCMSMINCEGEPLYDYYCDGLLMCCDTENAEDSCEDLDGIICEFGEFCQGGDFVYVEGLGSGEECCVGGTCQEIGSSEEYDCESNSGVCEMYSCGEGYEENFEYTCEFGDICCMEESGSSPGTFSTEKNMWWIWVLFALIVLVLIGILFRDKLREFLMRLKKKRPSKPSPPGMGRPGFPPAMPPTRPVLRPSGRRIIPPRPMARKPLPPRTAPKRSSRELDDVLKKLKNMSNE